VASSPLVAGVGSSKKSLWNQKWGGRSPRKGLDTCTPPRPVAWRRNSLMDPDANVGARPKTVRRRWTSRDGGCFSVLPSATTWTPFRRFPVVSRGLHSLWSIAQQSRTAAVIQYVAQGTSTGWTPWNPGNGHSLDKTGPECGNNDVRAKRPGAGLLPGRNGPENI
jgi:hypothetical protein